MPDAKSTLSCASSEALGSKLTLNLSKDEARKLASFGRKTRTGEKLPPAAHELAMALWFQVTGIHLPAAVTLESSRGRKVASVVRKVEMWHDKSDGWSLQVVGLNIRKTGATGNTLEWYYIRVGESFGIAKRTLLGEWLPVLHAPAQEAVC